MRKSSCRVLETVSVLVWLRPVTNQMLSSISKPTAIGGRPSRLFSICATETQWIGACSASWATLVPTLSGCGVEARATTALFSVNRREAAARARVSLRIFIPKSINHYCFQ